MEKGEAKHHLLPVGATRSTSRDTDASTVALMSLCFREQLGTNAPQASCTIVPFIVPSGWREVERSRRREHMRECRSFRILFSVPRYTVRGSTSLTRSEN